MTNDFSKLFQQMWEQGQQMTRTLNPAMEAFQGKGFENLFPTMPKDMMEMYFGKTFNADGLDAKTRLLLTLGALTVLGAQAEAQIKTTVRHALEAGATDKEIAGTIAQMALFGGVPAMTKAMELAQSVIAEKEEK
ncbi:hypothetical protein CBW24_06600 [Pacificitalea manganoxidans]|jgi:4-carboxymuconolactone decarboxylase|uniref:Carboxymuconolactone decarboxylase-like domain-containing protein n=1 Tax=Pacificitalea manganoxidans TaxID=1411902 RepID=A0A291LYC6_9RHOB|nr:carboxymuconolactone decarboxylase family protein [Pacificitalea manganoxidans]MAQ44302.1 carboxymuconolactone decarboxylase family protein [Actibacterium sp.]OWU71123.1 hypothetical protein ATO2_02090 [Roseovarius sp. 22II1-1F6A]ATI41699.1 hypothetical protein CBW24_06600 [Pacificitalea manganoxidans]MBF52557.1 carboxymuconolactone decarboxylase family protein [Actibacterium sp.]MDR6309150.1 4-carboxymuconolactone decarboxylase [Pacificitalea manganoxidans]|tara:strand:+ start:154 stop:558 length:405 start_codon:yes stop_codon:yes gene_type:complete